MLEVRQCDAPGCTRIASGAFACRGKAFGREFQHVKYLCASCGFNASDVFRKFGRIEEKDAMGRVTERCFTMPKYTSVKLVRKTA